MKFFVLNQDIKEDLVEIVGNDVNHIKNVVRKKVGENIHICNTETGENYIVEILEMADEKIKGKIIGVKNSVDDDNVSITIFQGLPKSDKMELIIQKAVELGVYDITPIEMKRCVVKLDGKDKVKKQDRWQKISESAAKQSKRDYIPKINSVITLKEIENIYEYILVAYEEERENTLKSEIQKIKEVSNGKENIKIAIVIGPEGGIEEQEIEYLKSVNAKIVTLGKRILRTETVALNMLSILKYEFEN